MSEHQVPDAGESRKQNNGRPPRDYDWGEQTQQARTHTPEDWKHDVDEMRRKYGIAELDIQGEFDEPELIDPAWPDLVVHESSVERTLHPPGGRPVLVEGTRGSGKTTLFQHAAIRILDESPDIALWRGSTNRSGWLPLRHWTTLWLPAAFDVNATWMRDTGGDDSQPVEPVDDLEDVVRDVERYESVTDLLDQLGDVPDSTFHVVFPDPAFRGCEQVVAESDRTTEDLPFNPAWEPGDAGATPLIHWWFPFQVARIERGPFRWMSLMFDEARQFTPGGNQMRQDDQLSRTKVSWLCDALTDSRRANFSPWYANHKSHHMLTDLQAEFNYRVDMPDGRPNPHRGSGGEIPPGWKTVPMTKDLITGFDVGTALAFSESDRSWFQWEDVSGKDEIDDRWLRIQLEHTDAVKRQVAAQNAEDDDLELEFDDQVFSEWQNQMDHRLYVKEPGEGWLSVEDLEVGEELVSPIDELAFDGIVDADGYAEVRMFDGDRSFPVARIPKDGKPGFKSTAGSGAEVRR